VVTNGWISSARALTPCLTSTPVSVVINAQLKLDAGADVGVAVRPRGFTW